MNALEISGKKKNHIFYKATANEKTATLKDTSYMKM